MRLAACSHRRARTVGTPPTQFLALFTVTFVVCPQALRRLRRVCARLERSTLQGYFPVPVLHVGSLLATEVLARIPHTVVLSLSVPALDPALAKACVARLQEMAAGQVQDLQVHAWASAAPRGKRFTLWLAAQAPDEPSAQSLAKHLAQYTLAEAQPSQAMELELVAPPAVSTATALDRDALAAVRQCLAATDHHIGWAEPPSPSSVDDDDAPRPIHHPWLLHRHPAPLIAARPPVIQESVKENKKNGQSA